MEDLNQDLSLVGQHALRRNNVSQSHAGEALVTASNDGDLPLDPMFLVQMVAGSVGLVSNVFVVVVIVRMTSLYKQLTNIFVINQSVIDAVSSLVLIVQTLADLWVPGWLHAGHLPSELYCRLWDSKFLMWSMFLNSTINLCVLTVERYVKVIHPVMYKNSFSAHKARLLIACTWTFGPVYMLVTHLPFDGTVKVTHCSVIESWSTESTKRTVGLLTVVLSYCLPILLYVVAYSRMIRKMRHSGARNNKQRAQRNLTKTLVLVVVGFVVCWSPNQCYYLLHNLGLPLTMGGPIYELTTALVCANCCINCFIYIANYEEFRAGIAALFGVKRRCRQRETTPIAANESDVTNNHSQTEI